MTPPALTILTDRIEPRSAVERGRLALGSARRRLSGRQPAAVGARGPEAVTASLVRGLDEIGARYSFAPRSLRDVAPVVLVPNSVPALRQAIGWRAEGRIDLLLAGPNVAVWSTDHHGILASPEIDCVLVPSPWPGVAYVEDDPRLDGRVEVWAAGIDARAWSPRPTPAAKARTCLLYVKSAPAELGDRAAATVAAAGWTVERITYGSYTPAEFRAALGRSRVAVFLSASESQGIALAEAWAMDVPTLAWDPEELVYNGRRYSTVTSAPYLGPETGARWKAVEELAALLQAVEDGRLAPSPRGWVLAHQTDAIAARNLLSVIERVAARMGGAAGATPARPRA